MNKQRGSGLVDLMVLVSFFAIMFGTIWTVDYFQCKGKTDMMQLESRWGPVMGCMVQVDRRWVPLEMIRIIDGKIQISGDGE